MFSRSTAIKYNKKQDLWKNSTGSIKIDVKNGRCYSYNEKIAYVNTKESWAIFNNHHFSVTTSKHQGMISRFIEEKFNIPRDRVFILDLRTLNFFDDSEDFKNLKDQIVLDEFNTLEKLYASKVIKLTKKDIIEVKSRLDEDFKKKKLDQKIDRLKENLRNLNYISEKNYLKALKDLETLKGSKSSIVLNRVDNFKIGKFKMLLSLMENKEAYKALDPIYYLEGILKNFEMFRSNTMMDFKESLAVYCQAHDIYKGPEIILSNFMLENTLKTLNDSEKIDLIKLISSLEKIDSYGCDKILKEVKTAEIFSEIGG